MNGPKFLESQQVRRRSRKRSLAMLIGAMDLPGNNWTMIGEECRRLRHVGGKVEETSRAMSDGAYTALRFFEERLGRGLWSQVTPLTTPDDARSRVPKLHERVNNNSGRVVTQESHIKNPPLSRIEVSTGFEQITNGHAGLGVGRYVGGNVENVLFMVAATAIGDSSLAEVMEWAQLFDIAQRQADRIREIIGAT